MQKIQLLFYKCVNLQKIHLPEGVVDIYSWSFCRGIEYEFYLNDKHGTDNFDSICANLFPDCRKQTYRLQIEVHADTVCFLKVAEQVLNYDLLAPIERLNGMETLLYKEIPFSETNEVIAKEMEILLTKIKVYRDKHYPR